MSHPNPAIVSSRRRVLLPAMVLAALIPALGDWITRASAIVMRTVDEVGSPYWNAEDGQDWSEEWAADPHSYDVTPVAVFPLTIGVESVLAAPGEGPAIAPGEKVEVFAPQSTGSVSGKVVFFLYWGKLYLSDGFSVKKTRPSGAKAMFVGNARCPATRSTEG